MYSNTEHNKALVVEAMTALFQRRDVEAVARLYSPHYVQHNPSIPQGRDALAALVAKLGAGVLLSAACLVACIPAGVEAAGRQVTHLRHSTGTAPLSEHVRYICRGGGR